VTTSPLAESVAALYERESARLGYTRESGQRKVVAELDALRSRLTEPTPRKLLTGLITRAKSRELQQGVYLWGGVGRGKTWLMDLFFQSLPFKDKQRSHFHRFMQFVHDELKKHAQRSDPLELVADKIARKARVLCFDELFVTDIADAMLLGHLFRGLFARGVTLVATSNVPPDELYKDGLQRARFLPAIRLLKERASCTWKTAPTIVYASSSRPIPGLQTTASPQRRSSSSSSGWRANLAGRTSR
jgi:cell division protein ZapE